MDFVFSNSPFVGDISEWNTASVTKFTEMFDGSAFAGGLSAWTFSDEARIAGMFDRNNAMRLALLEGTAFRGFFGTPGV